jgi:hypothetical protein
MPRYKNTRIPPRTTTTGIWTNRNPTTNRITDNHSVTIVTTSSLLQSSPDDSSAASEEVQRLREQAAKIRQEVADLEGKTLSQVEQEAQEERFKEKQRIQELETKKNAQQETSLNKPRGKTLVYVPQTIQDQQIQAANAIEKAFKNGITRQTIRLALVRFNGNDDANNNNNSNNSMITPEEDLWPGGAKEMYREAAKPLTEALLHEIRAIATNLQTEEEAKSGKDKYPPTIRTQDIWDFDGSALVTAEAAIGPSGDVQALVFPNTDDKYLNDIASIDKNLGKDRLFLLVNPFWRNVESWGFNILAPNAKKRAQEIIFNAEGGGFQETYVFSRFSVRGEDCVAIKAYPNDWELFAYLEEYGYGYGGRPTLTTIRLGSSTEEPTSALFAKLLNERDEFKMNKTMRQLNQK